MYFLLMWPIFSKHKHSLLFIFLFISNSLSLWLSLSLSLSLSLWLSLFLTHNQTFSHTSCFRCGRNVCLLSNAWRIEIGRIYGQCGQMTRLFVQHLRLSTTMKIFPESIKIAKGRFIFCQILNKPREKWQSGEIFANLVTLSSIFWG